MSELHIRVVKENMIMENNNNESLIRKIELHKAWVDTIGKEGVRLDLQDCDLQGADLSGMNLTDAILPKTRFNNAKMIDTILYGANLASAVFDYADLSGVALNKGLLDYASFVNTALIGSSALRATFIEANLKGANFMDSDLRWADFQNSNLEECTFQNADLSGAYLGGAQINNVDFTGAKGLDSVKGKYIYIETDGFMIKLEGDEMLQWLIKASGSTANT